MPRVVIVHAIEEKDRWLAGHGERAAAIEGATGSNVTDFLAADGSNNAAITADVEDVAALDGLLSSPSPELLAVMQAHGVVPPISAYVQA
ncbi:hypothetical protein [Marmoricola sp. RAF53]|uniref:hypothetical protein n=1 Tax=Marmoricola sp. RAF53 TaxID=3233059 RepID=UPI003F9DF1CE